jgi:hypothetical protein
MRGIILICVLATGVPLTAITVRPLSFAELVDRSTAVVHGRVSEVRGQWTADRHGIDSLVTIDVMHYLKGSLGDSVTVRVPGGQAGGRVNIIPGAPTFAQGDQVVLFLRSEGPSIPIVTGTSQGVYRVTTDARSGGLMVIPPLVETAVSGRIVRGDLNRRPLAMDAFIGAVRGVQVAR